MSEAGDSVRQDAYLAVKAVMMPRDTNPHGTIFGGVILSYIDQAGVVGARDEMAKQGWPSQALVTVAMNQVEFHQPVLVGDTVSFFTRVERVGRTSITMHVNVLTSRQRQEVQVTEARVTYVAIALEGEERVPVAIRGDSRS